jgi:3-mercaptopyruvate sulfurtransferase SseA
MAEHTSARAALDLDRLGVKGVKALKGGIQAWVDAGHPLAAGAK